MSFERFFSSDVYIFEHVGGYIQCCACSLAETDYDEIFGFTELATPREALVHLDLHEAAGHDIGAARVRIEKAYSDLDKLSSYITHPESPSRFNWKR